MNLNTEVKKKNLRRAGKSHHEQSLWHRRAARFRIKRAADIIESEIEAVGTVKCYIERIGLDTLRVRIDDKITKHHIKNFKISINKVRPHVIAVKILKNLIVEPLEIDYVKSGVLYKALNKND